MSAIGVILNLNGAPVLSDEVHALSENLAGRGPDGSYQYVSGNIGMCYRPFHTTRESWQEKQPIASRDGSTFVMDGILFNREELLDFLADDLNEDRTDAGLVAAGLQSYGADFLSKIVGDFALVYYQRRNQTLLLARDSFGVRPVFYHTNNRQAIVASDIRALLKAVNKPLRLDDDYLSGYLALFPEPHRTPYQDFHAVEPGQMLTLRKGELRTDRLWTIKQSEIRYQSDKDYEERLLHE